MSAVPAAGGAPSAALRASAVAALACVIVAAAIELGTSVPTRPASTGLPPILVSLALLCVAGLTLRRAASVAWIAAATAAGLAAIDAVGLDRAAAPSTPPELIVATALRAVPVMVAAGYLLSRPEHPRGSAVAAVGLGGLVATAVALIAALAAGWNDPRAFDGEWSRVANRVALLDVVLSLGLGTWIDAAPAWARARRRWRSRGAGLSWRDRGRILVEELLPVATETRRAAIEAERTRLAAELHATVLPSLRTALAASQAGSKEAAERGLGEAVDEVEQLMASREPVIVDALGLLAGVEWLAERLQVRFGIPVEIDVESARERPPTAVERAAFRVVQLSLDNVARHSGASTVRIAGIIFADVVELSVQDDGVGMAAGEGSHDAPGRGLRDMAAAANSASASVIVGPPPPGPDGAGSGTTVRFKWHSR